MPPRSLLRNNVSTIIVQILHHAEPYAQAVVRIRPQPGFALVAAGGGGGAAQLLPASLLLPIIVRAEAALTSPRSASDALRALFDRIEADVSMLHELLHLPHKAVVQRTEQGWRGNRI